MKYGIISHLSATLPDTIVQAVAANTNWKNHITLSSSGNVPNHPVWPTNQFPWPSAREYPIPQYTKQPKTEATKRKHSVTHCKEWFLMSKYLYGLQKGIPLQRVVVWPLQLPPDMAPVLNVWISNHSNCIKNMVSQHQAHVKIPLRRKVLAGGKNSLFAP